MTHIGDYPTTEMYAAGLEIDCQCARCGSSVDSERCDQCEQGGVDVFDDDPDGFDTDGHVCDNCQGNYVFHTCMSSPEWCQANPLPGREAVERGKIEWFTI